MHWTRRRPTRKRCGRDRWRSRGCRRRWKLGWQKVGAERNKLMKEKVELEENEKTLYFELEKCHSFMLWISEEFFQQGVRQTAFYHNIPVEDPRYDLEKDMVDGKLVPLGENVDAVMDENKWENDTRWNRLSQSHHLRRSLRLFNWIYWTRIVGLDQSFF